MSTQVQEDLEDMAAVVCNYREGTPYAAKGARAYVMAAKPDRCRVLVKSRGGRWVEHWERLSALGNFRRVTIPAVSPLYKRLPPAGMHSWLIRGGA